MTTVGNGAPQIHRTATQGKPIGQKTKIIPWSHWSGLAVFAKQGCLAALSFKKWRPRQHENVSRNKINEIPLKTLKSKQKKLFKVGKTSTISSTFKKV